MFFPRHPLIAGAVFRALYASGQLKSFMGKFMLISEKGNELNPPLLFPKKRLIDIVYLATW
jgi:hypothetical protein